MGNISTNGTITANSFIGSLQGTATNANALGGYGSDSYIQKLHWESGDGNSANTPGLHGVGFAYGSEHSTPATGPFCSFGAANRLKNYVLQLNAAYYDSNPRLYWRTYNGDTGSWNNWSGALMQGDTLNTSNYGTATPSAAGSNGDVYFKLI